jgi:deoxycytidine triphosphate deaminase
MILSDRTIREELDAGRIVIDPLDEQSTARWHSLQSVRDAIGLADVCP